MRKCWVEIYWPACFWIFRVWLIRIFSCVHRVSFGRLVCRAAWFKQVFSFFSQGECFGLRCTVHGFCLRGFSLSTFPSRFSLSFYFIARAATCAFRFPSVWFWLTKDVFSWVLLTFWAFVRPATVFRVFTCLKLSSVALLCAFGCLYFPGFSPWQISCAIITSTVWVDFWLIAPISTRHQLPILSFRLSLSRNLSKISFRKLLIWSFFGRFRLNFSLFWYRLDLEKLALPHSPVFMIFRHF